MVEQDEDIKKRIEVLKAKDVSFQTDIENLSAKIQRSSAAGKKEKASIARLNAMSREQQAVKSELSILSTSATGEEASVRGSVFQRQSAAREFAQSPLGRTQEAERKERVRGARELTGIMNIEHLAPSVQRGIISQALIEQTAEDNKLTAAQETERDTALRERDIREEEQKGGVIFFKESELEKRGVTKTDAQEFFFPTTSEQSLITAEKAFGLEAGGSGAGLITADKSALRNLTGREALDLKFPLPDESDFTPTQQNIRKGGEKLQDTFTTAGEKTSGFLIQRPKADINIGHIVLGGALTGLVSSPFTLASFGTGLLTRPVETARDFLGGFADIPATIARDPAFESGRLFGEVAGQFLILGAGGKVKTGAKSRGARGRGGSSDVPPTFDLLRTDSFAKSTKGKTPFSTTFPIEFDIVKLTEPKSTFKSVKTSKPLEVSIDPSIISDIEFAQSVQKARLSSGADVVQVNEFGGKIVEAPKSKSRFSPREITFELDKPLVQRFDIVEESTKPKSKPYDPNKLTFELDKPLVQRFDIVEESTKPKSKTKPKPLEFKLDENAIQDAVDFRKNQQKTRLESEADIIKIDEGGTRIVQGEQLQILEEPKAKAIQKDIIIDLDAFDIQPFQKAKVKPKPKPLEIIFDMEKPVDNLIGISRSVGGKGLTSSQLETFGRMRTAGFMQQVKAVEITDISLGNSQFAAVGSSATTKFSKLDSGSTFGTMDNSLSASKFGNLDSTLTTTIQLQLQKSSPIFGAAFKTKQLSVTKQKQETQQIQKQNQKQESLQLLKFKQPQPQVFDQMQLQEQDTFQSSRLIQRTPFRKFPIIRRELFRQLTPSKSVIGTRKFKKTPQFEDALKFDLGGGMALPKVKLGSLLKEVKFI